MFQTVSRFKISLVEKTMPPKSHDTLFLMGFYLQTEMMCDHSLWSSSPADLTCRGNASAREFQVPPARMRKTLFLEKKIF
jgi:hypothetical protein